MKVLHAMTFVGRRSYGLGAVAGPLVAEQRRCGLDASIWSLDTRGEADEASGDYGLPEGALRRFDSNGPRSLGFSFGLRHAVQDLSSNAIDVIHQHGIWTGVSHALAGWRRRNPGRTVVAPHGSLAPWALARSAWKKHLALAAYERENLREAGCLHVLSRLELEQARSFGIRGPVACIPAGITHEWLESKGDGNRFRKRHQLPTDQRLLLFVGRISPVKNLSALLKAWARTGTASQGWGLVLAGVPEFGYEVEVRREAALAGLDKQIYWLGPVYGDDKRDAYAAAECLVLPSFTENFGVVVLEALASARPAMTSTGGPWSILEDERCGWWVKPDIDTLAGALLRLFSTSQTELRSMGARGHHLAQKEFAWPRICDRTRRLYQWIRHGGGTPPFVTLD